jgi:amino acid transporter
MAIFGGRGRQLILILAMLSAISALNAGLLLAPRILFGMARDITEEDIERIQCSRISLFVNILFVA